MAERAITVAALRAEVRAALPEQIRAVLAGYADQAGAAPAPAAQLEDVKAVAAHHAACKAALQHAEMLVKLLRWAEADGPAPPPDPGASEVAALLAEARAALGHDEGEEDED